ncbi:Putative HTH-type transcriptional regulator [Streptomyces hundungensis]|uniref:HTH-type transcriptional regulator n=2 Tax=Streptomyces hundungensis TaxID=1077946 RepID=A0A387HNI5_9ACTN|nr:BTAD domain-containing putative transcriptional regulator [Streptomyces hundungensis]AYG81907.1 Putative HTH-type transcriptional regulator [Streptomyces hundungensis]
MTTELTLLTRVAYRGQEVTAPRLRGLLALLAEDLRAGCSTGRLVEGLWDDELPERPGKAVQVLVSRVRSQLGPEVIASTPAGYRIALAEDQVDSSALLLHAAAAEARARAGEHGAALAEAEAGLALWDGVVASGDGEDLRDPVAALRLARAGAHRSLARSRALALARLGRKADAVRPLAQLARELPRDEEVLAELLRCEAATAGPAAALTRYDLYRRALRDELGADPGPQLAALHRELLRGEAPLVRHGVLHEPNPLLGRDDDLAAIAGLLHTARVVTVVGPGGLGKTRLAHAVGRAAEQRVVHFVPLAGVTSDDDVATEVASVLGAGAARGLPGPAGIIAGIVGALGPGPALLVLDNCEHVIRGAAELVRALVAGSKELRILATSRAPLGLTSESVYALGELGLVSTVELFRQRARAARPDAELPEGAVQELCRQLDGLPLAVELAAARVRVLSVPEIARRLRDRFALLRGGGRDVPERHRTLRAVVEWSWNLLEPEAQAALRVLSVFPGGFTEDAAEHVLGDQDALFLLEQLADQSLIKAADTHSGVRFHMLETVREFSAARRAEAAEEDAVTGRFLAWARDFGRVHHDALFSADSLRSWELARREQDNLVLALRYALARDDGPTLAGLTAVLASLWATDSNYSRLTGLAADTAGPLSHFRPGPDDIEPARSAAVVCTLSLFMGYGPHAVRQLVTLRRLPTAEPDTLLRALDAVLRVLPEVRPPHYARLRELCEAENAVLAGVAECFASYVWEFERDVDRALDSARRSVAALTSLGNPATEMLAHGRVSELCLQTERGEEAYRHLLAALDVLERTGDWSDAAGWYDTAGVRWALVLACIQRGELEEAERWLELAGLEQPPESSRVFSPELGSRAEIALLRGLTEVGLGLWRQAVAQLREADVLYPDDPFMAAWSRQIQATALAAHARHGRLEPVADLAAELRSAALELLTPAGEEHSPAELPVSGTVLLAVGMAELAGGRSSGVRLLALAERMRVHRDFPTMSAARARAFAEDAGDADGAAYADAVSEYAALGRDELAAAAVLVLRGISAGDRG